MAVAASMRKLPGRLRSYLPCCLPDQIRARFVHCSPCVWKQEQEGSTSPTSEVSWDVAEEKNSPIPGTIPSQEKPSFMFSSNCKWKVDERLDKIAQRRQQFGPIDNSRCMGQPIPETHPHLLPDGQVTPGITKKEYRDRRHRFMSLLSRTHYGESHDKHAVIIPSNPTLYMATDVPYPFRQNSNFLYLTGFQEADTVLVLETQGGLPLPIHRSVLYVRPRDPKRELWEGPRAGVKGATDFFGVDEAHPISELSSSLIQKYSNKDYCIWYDHMKPHHPEIHKEISRVLFQSDQFTYKNLLVVGHNIHMLRLIKTEAEIKLMRKSCSVASEAITRVMHSTRPGIEEAHLQTLLEYECRMQGAERLAYPPVIASGSMANVLHYINNTQLLRNDELLLMDAGCEYHGYSSDITRTWPVGGKFTPPQRQLYEVVLRVQKKCIALCQKDVSLDYLHHAMLLLLGEELTNLGFIKNGLKEGQMKKAVSQFCPHHVGHYLGMDVHDTHLVSRGLGLQPGMVVTVEPGLYIPQNAKDLPERYRGIGIRIEDDILITNNGPEVLTAECPKEVEDIESLMNK